MDTRTFYIGGDWVEPAAPRDEPVINPATEEAFATISLGAEADIDRAVRAAADAFPAWSESPVETRCEILANAIDIYQSRSEKIASTITEEMGSPISFSEEMQTPCGDGHLAATLDALRSHAFERPSARGASVLRDEPVGLCGLITPWNWPINQVAAKVAPALAAGCTMVLKPSELSPLSAMMFVEVLADAGCPPGVLNLVNGDGVTAGAALSSHPSIDMVSFTGSTRAGVAISHAAAPTIKRIALELGGKSPNLLFEDADLAAAVEFSVNHCFSNSGQSCDAPTRLLVQRSVYNEVVTMASEATERCSLGDPTLAGPHLGPVVSQLQFDRIQALIKAGLDEGARLAVGGLGRPETVERGYYVKPTLFVDVDNQMRIAQEEIFGPVLSIIPFDTEEQAIAIANDTPYGLAAYIQTGDLARANRVARRLRAGTISINGEGPDFDVPFGGYKASGIGREYGSFGLHDYLETKAITAPPGA